MPQYLASLHDLDWQCKSFHDLTNDELYQILRLRNEVFVVEQNCAYQDCDNLDQPAFHLFALNRDEIVAYSRLLPVGISYPDGASIGRVIVKGGYRNLTLGRVLMSRSIERIHELFGNHPIYLGAQMYLMSFYADFGFVACGETYLEDGIPHICMVRHP